VPHRKLKAIKNTIGNKIKENGYDERLKPILSNTLEKLESGNMKKYA